jgi:hypothetical protein
VNLHGYSGDGSEDQDAHRNEDSKSNADKVPEGNEVSFGNCLRGHLSYTMAKNSAAFFFFLPNFCGEAELKDNGPFHLEEEISRQQSTQAVAWLLLATFSQIYNKNQGQRGTNQKDLKTLQASKKRRA